MKGNKKKIAAHNSIFAKNDYIVWLGRIFNQNGGKPLSVKVKSKSAKTFGFTRKGLQMMELGYKPKYQIKSELS